MACVNTSSEQQASGPRISFSNNFVMDSSGPFIKHERPRPRPPLLRDDDFEFSPGGAHPPPMIAADEVFFKGKLMPLKRTTLRDELVVEEEEGHVARSKPSKIRWFLGLRKGGKKQQHEKGEEAETTTAAAAASSSFSF